MNDEELVVALVGAAVVYVIEYIRRTYVGRQPYRVDVRRGFLETQHFIGGTERICRQETRMSQKSFYSLVNLLCTRGLLEDNKLVLVEEQVMIFLHCVGHHIKNSTLKNRFGHSGEIVSRHFNRVLNAMMKLHPLLLKPPSLTTHKKIADNHQSFYPFFKDCVGAIDGSHIPAWVPVEQHRKFRDRKGLITQNILAACDHDKKFTYILAGWEGSASDSRILDDALHRDGDGRLVVPNCKFYLADAGFANQRGFLSPYRNVRYHLKEWKRGNQRPKNEKELFNLRHARLRHVIEGAFSLLKSRFKILATRAEFPFRTQVKIVIACVLLHNHILNHDSLEEEEEWLAQESREGSGPTTASSSAPHLGEDEESSDSDEDEENDAEAFRNDLAIQMWNAYASKNVNDEDMGSETESESND